MTDPQSANATPAAGLDAARRELLARQRRRAWLPFLGGLFLFAAVMTAVIAAAGPHIGVLADLIAISFCLIPLVVVSFLAMISVVAVIWGIGRLDVAAVRQTARAENAAADLAERTRDIARSSGARVIGISAAVERFAPLWRIFDREDKKGDDDGA